MENNVAAEVTTLSPRVANAAKELGLRPEHVAASREAAEYVTIVTKGGRRLRWPPDALTKTLLRRGLSTAEKDGVVASKAPLRDAE